MKNARLVALKTLLRVNQDNAYSNIALDNAINDSGLEDRDIGFITAIFYGVLERKITLDYIVSNYSKVPLKKISSEALEILRMGIYQILYMDKVPNSAAVNESVKLAKLTKQHGAVGFINGVLRSVVRGNANIKITKGSNNIKDLSIEYSCPEWIIDLWINSYGEEITNGILGSLNGRPELTARVNNTKITLERLIDDLKEEGISVRGSSVLDQAIELKETGSIEKLKSFCLGQFHIQDLASQICCKALSPKPGQTIIDVCSAPGGKTFTLAEIMQNEGKVLAFDLYESKAKLIKDGAKRLGLSIVDARVRDALTEKVDLPLADRVLCDVPCSGLGILRRKPEIRYKKEIPLDELYSLQYKILCESSKFTAIDGILVYSTCTLNPNENNLIANRFLDEHVNYIPYTLNLPNNIKSAINEKPNQITLFPHIHKTDGFFISAFKRIG